MARISAKIDEESLRKAKSKLKQAADAVEPTARSEAARVLESIYLPKLKELTPRGVHYGPRGGIIDKPIRERLVGSYVFQRHAGGTVYAKITSTSPYIKFVLFGAKRHKIRPKNVSALAFWWPNAPKAVIEHQHGKGSENKYLHFKYVNHPGQKRQPFHREAYNAVKDQMRAEIVYGFKTKIRFQLGRKEGEFVIRARPKG